jgi:hypothetical protein
MAEPTAITLTVTMLIGNTRYDETHASDMPYHSSRSDCDGQITSGSTLSGARRKIPAKWATGPAARSRRTRIGPPDPSDRDVPSGNAEVGDCGAVRAAAGTS